MYNFYIWDKKSAINNVNAADILRDNPFFGGDEIVFCYADKTGKVSYIECFSILRSNLNMPTATPEEVGHAYLKQLNDANNGNNDQATIEELKEQNEKLEAELRATNAAVMELYELVLGPTTFSVDEQVLPRGLSESMAKIYASAVIYGDRTFESVPYHLKELVQEELAHRGYDINGNKIENDGSTAK